LITNARERKLLLDLNLDLNLDHVGDGFGGEKKVGVVGSGGGGCRGEEKITRGEKKEEERSQRGH